MDCYQYHVINIIETIEKSQYLIRLKVYHVFSQKLKLKLNSIFEGRKYLCELKLKDNKLRKFFLNQHEKKGGKVINKNFGNNENRDL